MSLLYKIFKYFIPDIEKEYNVLSEEEIKKDIEKNKEKFKKVIDDLPTYKEVLTRNLLEGRNLSQKQKQQLRDYYKSS